MNLGQARKSLWIETYIAFRKDEIYEGQARKSLWIETIKFLIVKNMKRVRLVRACGSKRILPPLGQTGMVGQARKSLWIET